MDSLLYLAARGVIAFLQALPLPWVARIGRAGGSLAYWLDGRHRRAASRNLRRCFGAELSPVEIRTLARENFRRIGESYACAVKTAGLNEAEIRSVLEIVGLEKFRDPRPGASRQSQVFAIGHFGNFELFAHCRWFAPEYRFATTYRGLRQPSLNRLLQRLRALSGSLFFERRTEASALKAAMNQGGLVLGFLADQHAGDHGLRVPFFGHDCSTSAAPAVFALRYRCPLYTAICYRAGLGRWRIEVGDPIPTREQGRARSTAAITQDINRAFEAAIRRDPANWFWVHNRWKPGKPRPQRSTSATQTPTLPNATIETTKIAEGK